MKISGRQIFWMMFTFEVGQSLLLVIPATIRTVKQDAWISILIAGVIGVALTFWQLHLVRFIRNKLSLNLVKLFLVNGRKATDDSLLLWVVHDNLDNRP